jgi:hypothetical protein
MRERMMRKLAAMMAVFAIAGASLAAPAAFSVPPKDKCNSGGGNGSEVPGDDCDPGNSGGNNNAGD